MQSTESIPFVMVAGTGRHELTPEELRLARAVGRGLAREGFGLITCGWPGIDAEVGKSFAGALAAEVRPAFLKQFIYPKPTLRTLLRDLTDGDLLSRVTKTALIDPRYVPDALHRRPEFLGGQLIEVQSEEEEYQSVAQADAVVLIGGMSGTERVAEIACQHHKPVLPLATKAGASRALFQQMISATCESRPGRFSLPQLRGLVGDRDTVVANLMRLLHFVLGPTEDRPGRPVYLYISHVLEDEAQCRDLLKHLRPLQRQGRIVPSRRRDIDPGATLATAVQEHVGRAEIILLLVSASYFASDTCWTEELGPAIERHRAGEAMVIPVLLKPVADLSPLDGMAVLPEQGALLDRSPPDAVWQQVTVRVAQAAVARQKGDAGSLQVVVGASEATSAMSASFSASSSR